MQSRLILLLVGVLGLAAPAAARPGPRIPHDVRALIAEKEGRTPAQRKLSSRLLYAARMRRGRDVAPGIRRLRTRLMIDADGTLVLDLRGRITRALLARIRELGGRVIVSHPRRRSLRARLPVSALESIAGLPEVRSVRPAERAYTRKINTSEGDAAHAADLLRSNFGVDGSGISIGVLSDGVDFLAALQTSGDLPANVTVLPGRAGLGSEGTAMLEILHDLAPGAQLLFATAFDGQAAFAADILALRNAGADVIVDDVGYFGEAVFQDDDIAQAADAVVADGALYFSAAGNAGNKNDGTAGVWEGDFVDSGTVFGIPPRPAHEFVPGVIENEITVASPFLYSLHWSDPIADSDNDFDLYLVDAQGQVVAASTDDQKGKQDPIEIIDADPTDAGLRLVVVQFSGKPRYLHLNANRGRLTFTTGGQTSGHSAAQGAVSVAAVDQAIAGGPGGRFDGSESVETFSSDGPRRIFYHADGTAITPGDLSATGGVVRQKPDLVGADCVSTATPGFTTFCGTSAAAPHAAAQAALLLQLARSLSDPAGPLPDPSGVRDALFQTALDIEAPGVDPDSGAGIIDGLAAAFAIAPDACSDGFDNDGDGLADFPDDPGCADALDPSERSATLPCDDGLDNDGDGLADFVDFDGDGISDPPGDPGCRLPQGDREDPACDDDQDNDGDGGIDWDGGSTGALADLNCQGRPWHKREARRRRCGVGFEVVLLLLPLAALHRRRARN